jgi:hypothetical protein
MRRSAACPRRPEKVTSDVPMVLGALFLLHFLLDYPAQ